MANSYIKITFTEDLEINDQLGIEIGFDTIPAPFFPNIPGQYAYKWVANRTSSMQVSVGTPTVNPGERTAINFVTAFNLDASGFVVTRNVNEVTITYVTRSYMGMTTSANFVSPITFFDYFNNELIFYANHPSIEIQIFNSIIGLYAIDTTTFSTSANPCTNVDMVIETNELTTAILSPIVVNPNTNNPFTINVLRGQDVTLILENASGDTINTIISTPSILNASNFTIDINNSPVGASVIINSVNSDDLTLQYSLDNINWQNSNTFPGVLSGNYTLYVRDSLGCSFTKTFNVNDEGIYVPYFKISKANSIRFANRIIWGDSENYKTDENTLSCEVDVKQPETEIQRFQSADVITTQFESNFSINTAKIIKQDHTEVTIPVVKMSNNIGLKDKRDARLYSLGAGKSGVYFIAGNVYDYVLNSFIGTYALNGTLPNFGKIGNYINVLSVWYLIEDIIYDESKNADVLVISNAYVGPEINIIASSIYNRFNHEVYEFKIDMVDYIDQKFRVEFELSDPKFTTITHLSEILWIKIKHLKTLDIAYKNTTNSDLDYSTGIQNRIRIPYISFKGKSDGDSEIHKTDTDTILINADLYEGDEIQFEPLTKELWRKLMIALSCEILTIDGVGYVKNVEFNTEGPLNDTNLYVLTANMLKTGNVYNSQTSGNQDFDSTAVEVPGLIETDSGFVRY